MDEGEEENWAGLHMKLSIMWCCAVLVVSAGSKSSRAIRREYLTYIHVGVLSMLSDRIKRLMFFHVGSNDVCQTGSLISGAKKRIRSPSARKSGKRFVLQDR